MQVVRGPALSKRVVSLDLCSYARISLYPHEIIVSHATDSSPLAARRRNRSALYLSYAALCMLSQGLRWQAFVASQAYLTLYRQSSSTLYIHSLLSFSVTFFQTFRKVDYLLVPGRSTW